VEGQAPAGALVLAQGSWSWLIEFLIERHLDEFGEDSLVARTWHWVLHGGGRAPISHTDWTRFDGHGPPSAATLAAESTASEPPFRPPTPWDELNRARFICWLCTSQPEDGLPLRFHPWDAAVPAPTATAEGAVTITLHENPGN
jgi:hypothetical protein